MSLTPKMHDLLLSRFGRRVRELRLEKNLSYRALSQRCNVSIPDLERVENGKRHFTLSTAIEIAIGLRVQPKELFDFDMSPLRVEDKYEKTGSESN